MSSFARALRWLLLLSSFWVTTTWSTRGAHAQGLERAVVDRAGVLSPEAVSSLEAALRTHHAERSHQLAVLVVASTDGEPIEDYTHRTATEWGLGRAGRDDGVLFVLAVGDRRSRIEVGYGLEATLTDATSKQILDAATPSLRAADYDGAVAVVVNGLLTKLGGVPVVLPEQRTTGSASRATPTASSSGCGWFGSDWGFFVFILAAVMFNIFKSLRGGGTTYSHSGYSSYSSSSSSSSSSGSSSSDSGSSYGGGGGSFGGGGASSSW